MSTIGQVFAENLGRLIESRRVKKAHLSRTTGISRMSIDAYLANKNSPMLETVERFAAALDVSVWELLKSKASDSAAGEEKSENALKSHAEALLVAALGRPVAITIK